MPLTRIRPYLLPAIILFAVAVRAGYGLTHPAIEANGAISDADEYVRIGAAFADTGILAKNSLISAERMPAYPLFLGILFRLCGYGYGIILLSNCLLAAAAIYFLYRVGKNLFGETTGLIAAAISAAYPQFIFYAAHGRRETFTLALGALLFWSLLEAKKRQDAGWFVFSGIVGAVLALSNSVFLPYCLIIVPSVLVFLLRKKPRIAIRLGGAYALAFCLCYAPWPIRNHATFSEWIIGSTVTKYQIFYTYLIVPQEYGGTQTERDILATDSIFQRISVLTREERERAFKKAALEKIKQSPFRFIRLITWRALWDTWRPVPRKRAYSHNYTLIWWASLLSDGWIIPLGWLSILLLRLRPIESLWLHLYILSVAGSYSMFLTMMRYRLTLMPWLILFSAAMISRALSKRYPSLNETPV